MDRDNRKSHLAPQLSPATQELLRANDSPIFPTQTDGALQTPTSGEIPILGAMVSPRDQHGSVSSRSPIRNGAGPGSIGRAGGSVVHPGLGPQMTTFDAVSQPGQPAFAETGGSVLNGLPNPNRGGIFTLPVRPAPKGPIPPPPPQKEPSLDYAWKRENRRQATFGPPQNRPFDF